MQVGLNVLRDFIVILKLGIKNCFTLGDYENWVKKQITATNGIVKNIVIITL